MFYIYLFLCLACSRALPFFSSEFYHVMFADLSNFEDMMLPNMSSTEDSGELLDPDVKLPGFAELLQDDMQIGDFDTIINTFNTAGEVKGQDEKKFHELNQDICNFTRRSRIGGRGAGFVDNADYPGSEAMERRKIGALKNYGLQFLMHSRYKIAQALQQRIPIRNDKRYQLGFLFCRVRRIHTEMLKFIATAKEQYDIWWTRRTIVNLRFYQKVVTLDQDIKDTIEYIKEIYFRNATYDYERIKQYGNKVPPQGAEMKKG